MQMQTINPEDTSVLVAMMAAMQEDDPWSVPFEPARAREAVEELLQNPMYGRAWFVEEDGRRIGYIVMSFDYSLEFGGRNAWVDEFFIEKESRGRGIGAQVLNLFEQVAREAGAMAIHLGVSRGNRAIDLYRRQGFREHQGRFLTKFLW
jgi:GNAT superfamily N-acetyltransferase